MAGATSSAPSGFRRVATRSRRGPDGPTIWREAFWWLDWLSLRFSPVYAGLGVPRGDGSPVILVPGFLATDIYLMEMYLWLRRIGYKPFPSSLGVNADCIRVLTHWMENRVEDVSRREQRAVHLIGHSLGGLLARRVAVRRPDLVAQVISLGSPIRSLEAHPIVVAAARMIGEGARFLRAGLPAASNAPGSCLSDRCGCHPQSDESGRPPPAVRLAAIYTRRDGVVPWRNCLERDPSLNYEVNSTHVGLAFSPEVYRIVAGLLAQTTVARRGQAA